MIIDIGNPTHCLRDCPVCDCERMVCKADQFARPVDWTTETVPDWCPGKDMVVMKVRDAVEMLLTESATGWLALVPAGSSTTPGPTKTNN